ncbi:MAG: hypothetical protein HC866_11520 [Leptolyngbyaceae cyanobacterium RU_5_1]|nr:hypothetical protein [Leptolyngbyaceae cyanobacterium RU_5_1]
METSINRESHSISPLQSFQGRYVLTQVKSQQLIFPSQWVAEVILVERTQILFLPFYHPMVLGVIHHQGAIVPLISAHLLLSAKLGQDIRFTAVKEMLTIVRFSEATHRLTGVGIVVEHVVGSLTEDQVTDQHRLQLSDIPEEIWQPY